MKSQDMGVTNGNILRIICLKVVVNLYLERLFQPRYRGILGAVCGEVGKINQRQYGGKCRILLLYFSWGAIIYKKLEMGVFIMAKKLVIRLGKKKKDDKKNLKKGLAIGAAVGTAVGAVSGILLAPKSGKETRQLIKDETTKAIKKASDGIKDAVEVTAEKAKELIKKVHKNQECQCEECCTEENCECEDNCDCGCEDNCNCDEVK